MSGLFSVKKGTIWLDCQSKINNSSISNTSINMSNGTITNHGTPLNPTDVANKNYVDSLFGANFLTANVMLTGTAYSPVPISVLRGQIRVSVVNIVTNGPCASFEFSKNTSTEFPSQHRFSSSAGLTTFERLEMQWLPGESLSIRKTGANYNGLYNIKIYVNV